MQALNILKLGAEAMLKDRMEKVKANGINVRFITGMGAPEEGIIDVAENEQVDLIVMGSRELKRIWCWQIKSSWKCGKKSFRDCRISCDDNKVTITRQELN